MGHTQHNMFFDQVELQTQMIHKDLVKLQCILKENTSLSISQTKFNELLKEKNNSISNLLEKEQNRCKNLNEILEIEKEKLKLFEELKEKNNEFNSQIKSLKMKNEILLKENE